MKNPQLSEDPLNPRVIPTSPGHPGREHGLHRARLCGPEWPGAGRHTIVVTLSLDSF